ncbi:MerR family transcriptional regulator [Timonella senegalensis]|uniref:transcriptional regulator FtsR n=1 Tax=Timonella senegalensis TaxID=1465825 RepID=UPI002FDE9A58
MSPAFKYEAGQEEPLPSGSRLPWPHNVSHTATMRISDVLGLLRAEFPAVSHSKIRFLEDQELVTPERSAAGYRTFSPADVERLRYVLTEQRDRYLPLKVIKAKLTQLDSGVLDIEHPLGPRVVASGGLTPAQAEASEFANLAAAAGVTQAFVDELVEAGILRGHPRAQGVQDLAGHARRDVEIIKIAQALQAFGIDWRHLRSMRAAADRQVNVVDQSVQHLTSKGTSLALGEANSARAEMAELLIALHGHWLRDGLEELA